MSEIRKILDSEWVEDLVATHHRTVDKLLKNNRTVGEAYDEANREAKHTINQWHLAEVKRIIGPYEYGQSPALDPKEEYYIGRDNLRDEILKRAGLDTLPEGEKDE